MVVQTTNYERESLRCRNELLQLVASALLIDASELFDSGYNSIKVHATISPTTSLQPKKFQDSRLAIISAAMPTVSLTTSKHFS